MGERDTCGFVGIPLYFLWNSLYFIKVHNIIISCISLDVGENMRIGLRNHPDHAETLDKEPI